MKISIPHEDVMRCFTYANTLINSTKNNKEDKCKTYKERDDQNDPEKIFYDAWIGKIGECAAYEVLLGEGICPIEGGVDFGVKDNNTGHDPDLKAWVNGERKFYHVKTSRIDGEYPDSWVFQKTFKRTLEKYHVPGLDYVILIKLLIPFSKLVSKSHVEWDNKFSHANEKGNIFYNKSVKFVELVPHKIIDNCITDVKVIIPVEKDFTKRLVDTERHPDTKVCLKYNIVTPEIFPDAKFF